MDYSLIIMALAFLAIFAGAGYLNAVKEKNLIEKHLNSYKHWRLDLIHRGLIPDTEKPKL